MHEVIAPTEAGAVELINRSPIWQAFHRFLFSRAIDNCGSQWGSQYLPGASSKVNAS